MTNRIAIVLGVLIVTLLAVDILLFSAQNTVFLGRKLLDMIEWLAFWR